MSALSELCGKGWSFVSMPKATDEQSVIARYDGEPIRAGVKTETVTDTESEIHYQYRTGQYNLDIKIDFDVGRGRAKVEEAQGYDTQE